MLEEVFGKVAREMSEYLLSEVCWLLGLERSQEK